jgi:hypothetical protein
MVEHLDPTIMHSATRGGNEPLYLLYAEAKDDRFLRDGTGFA